MNTKVFIDLPDTVLIVMCTHFETTPWLKPKTLVLSLIWYLILYKNHTRYY